MIALWTALLITAASGGDSLLGEVRVVGPSLGRSVMLHVSDANRVRDASRTGDANQVTDANRRAADVVLLGDLVGEVAHLQSFQVEVLGRAQSDGFRVDAYRIIDIGHGARPLVGTVTEVAGALALTAIDDGTPIPLSAAASTKARLLSQVGAKVWVFGSKLLTGEMQVARYGILRAAPTRTIVNPNQGE